MLKSRKVVAALVGLILIFVNAWVNESTVDPDTVTNAIMGVVAALMASIAWEDSQKNKNPVEVRDSENINVITPPAEKVNS